MTIKAKKSKINLREKLAELLNFRQIRDRLDGLGLYLGKDRTGTSENLAVRGGASIDDLQLAEISAALGDTAVDVFVYDTRNDSDGGKWRERTQHTSWYNEELNTATRGGRREFPAVAVIVAESNKVTIYDGDDPDLPMWMVFNGGSNYLIGTGNVRGIFCLNGRMATALSNFLSVADFVIDTAWTYAGNRSYKRGCLTDRNEKINYGVYGTDYIVNDSVNDVAMTVLPNAPIDSGTGLPVPTIAVATDGGVSVIRDDGSVVDYTHLVGSNNSANNVNISKNGKLTYASRSSNEGYIYLCQYNNLSDTNVTSAPDVVLGAYQAGISSEGLRILPQGIITDAVKNQEYNFIGLNSDGYSEYIGAFFITQTEGVIRPGQVDNLLSASITTESNTGWMPGDIKLATLSDSTVETVGVDESTELVTNSEFTTDSDWTKESGWTIPGDGTAVASNASSTLYQIVDNLTIGQTYKISINVLTIASGSVSWRAASTSQGGALDMNSFATDTGIREIVFKADTTNMLIGVYGDVFSGTIGSLSLKQTGELITNGTFDNETTGWILSPSNKPTISSSGALQFNNVDGTAQSHAEQEIPTIAGEKYILSFDYVGSSTLNIYIGTSQGLSTILNTNISSSDSYSFSFVATSSSSWIRFRDNVAGSTPTIDNVSVRLFLAEPDRSVNDNGLQVFGEIDKTPVAPGADLVAYSGFSDDNYLMQPYNPDLNFGTGDFCIMGWVKFAQNSVYDRIMAKRHSWIIETGGDNSIGFKIWGGSNYGGGVSFVGDAVYGVWRCLCVKRESGVLSLFVDGVEKTDPNNPHLSSTDFTSEFGLFIGSDPDSDAPAEETSLSLLRISKTAPTAEQIAKIYQDERQLFTDGAQATLYGTSDAVTALAYDDKTELLHVGTSSGRSDFAGLRRINNTTTAVTTSISASNNLIAEQ